MRIRIESLTATFTLLLLLPLMALSGSVADVTNQRVLDEVAQGENWFLNGGDFSGTHFSALDEINAENVASLGLAWSTGIPAPDGIAGTPIVVDGTVYLGAAFSVVYALDAETGKILWSHDPGMRDRLVKNPDISWAARANRGIAVWDGKVFVATADCFLIALDAATGKQVWSEQTCTRDLGYAITDAPRVGGGRVYIGNAGSESGKQNRGYVSAYDAATGRMLWRFYTVPSSNPDENDTAAMRMAAESWTGDALQKFGGGGGSVWNEMTYDPATEHLYFGTAGSLPYLHRDRSPDGGDNLFTSSVIAVNARTGEYVWHYQTVPEDSWEYNANMNIVLADLELDGDLRKTLMIAPKNGFFYVLDRMSGELLSAEKYARVNWASHINMETGRPVLTEEGKYWNEPPGTVRAIWPNMWGAHSWQPMAFHPGTGLIYIPVSDAPSVVTMYEDGDYSDSMALVTEVDGQSHDPGKLLAWDPVSQRVAWSVAHDLPFNGGIMTSAGGLVFQGASDGVFSAYNAADGERLWAVSTGSPISSAPVSFSLNGTQHVLVAVGAGGGMQFSYPELHSKEDLWGPTRVLAFNLESDVVGSLGTFSAPDLPSLPEAIEDVELIAWGDELYHEHCSSCHGRNARTRNGGSVPDLRYASAQTHQEWPAIVLGGSRINNGMPRVEITAEEAEAIRSYVITRAHGLKASRQ